MIDVAIQNTHPDQGKDNKRGPRKRENCTEVVNYNQLPVQGRESREINGGRNALTF